MQSAQVSLDYVRLGTFQIQPYVCILKKSYFCFLRTYSFGSECLVHCVTAIPWFISAMTFLLALIVKLRYVELFNLFKPSLLIFFISFHGDLGITMAFDFSTIYQLLLIKIRT